MDVLIILVGLLILAGLFSFIHGLIKPAVDWVYPPAAEDHEPQPQTQREAWLAYIRKRKADRLEMCARLNRETAEAIKRKPPIH